MEIFIRDSQGSRDKSESEDKNIEDIYKYINDPENYRNFRELYPQAKDRVRLIMEMTECTFMEALNLVSSLDSKILKHRE